MDVKAMIDAIEALIKSMHTADAEEKIKTYATTKFLLDDLHSHTEYSELKNTPNYNLYIAEMFNPLRCLAGLSKGPRAIDCETYLNHSIRKLRGKNCYNVQD